MAGYRVQSTIYNLTFAKFEGLEISIKGLTTGQMMEMWDAKAASKSDSEVTVSKGTNDMFEMFVDALKEWNLEDEEGVPVPKTMDGIKSLDLPFVLSLCEGWTTALAGTGEELGKDLPSGNKSQEELIPMETS